MGENKEMNPLSRRSINILYVLNASEGGATQSALELIRCLDKSNFKIFIASPPTNREASLQSLKKESVDFAFIPLGWWIAEWRLSWPSRCLAVIKRLLRTGFHFGTIIQLTKLIRMWKIDLVYSNSIVFCDGALAARINGKPHIWHIRELFGDHYDVRFALPLTWMTSFIHCLSYRIICNTEATRKCFPKLSPKLLVLNNAINVDEFSNSLAQISGNALRETLGISKDEIHIAMCAKPTIGSKRHDVFVEMAFRILKGGQRNIRFSIFGEYPKREEETSSFKRLKAQIETLHLEAQIHFAGHAKNIPAMMNAIDILVHPSPEESFGRIFIEAMAASKPVIGINQGGPAEIIEDGTSGFLCPLDPDALAEKCLLLVSNPHLRARIGSSAHKRAQEKFSLDRLTAEISELFLSAASFKS